MKYTIVVSEYNNGKAKVLRLEGEGDFGEVMTAVSKWMETKKEEPPKKQGLKFKNMNDFNAWLGDVNWLGGEDGPQT